MKNYKIFCFGLGITLSLCILNPTHSLAQENLLNLLEGQEEPVTNYAEFPFKGSRLINGHTVVTRKKGELEFLIAHRFGRINTGAYEFFGLDGANVRLGLEYGLANFLTVGIGRNSFEKTYDGFVKAQILRQSSGAKIMPVSVTAFASMTINTLRDLIPEKEVQFSDRLAYTYQLLIARKFSDRVSIQLMPSVVHRNIVPETEENDIYALGAGGRFKLTKRVALNLEYYYRFNAEEAEPFYNSIAIGFDIETGGHVFQLHFTNSRAMIEKGFISETTGNFFNSDIHFGFNISRVFQLH